MSNSRGSGRAKNTAPKTRSVAITITVAVVLLLFIAALFINSKQIRRQVTAIETNGVKFTAAEYQFFYVKAVSEYTNYVNNTFGDNASQLLPDSSKPYESQTNLLTGQTWDVYYAEATLNSMKLFAGAYTEASNAGFTVPDEEYAEVDTQIDDLVEQVSMYYNMSFQKYLENYQYGPNSGVTEKLYRELSKKQLLVDKYAASIKEGFIYSESKLDDYYTEHRDDFDYYKFRFFTVRAETINEADFETTEEFEAADAAAVEAARLKAAEFVASISDEQDFLAKAKEYNPESYTKESLTLYHSSGEKLAYTFNDWLKDPSRQAGDMCAEPANEDEAENRAFFVVYYLDRLDNKYPTVNAQVMYIGSESLSTDAYLDENGAVKQEEYDNAAQQRKTALEEKANELFDEWESNGGTLDYLTKFYEENTSVKYGSLEEYTASISGSLYKNISRSYVVDDATDAWLQDSARSEGDIAVVRADDNTWYLLYFVGHDMDYDEYLADTALRSADYEAWENAFKSATSKTGWGMKLL